MGDATTWFSRNLAIAGFSEHASAFTTCKELIDNAVDASRATDQQRVCISIEAIGSDVVKICCKDWGSGFTQAALEALSNLFVSTKNDTCTSTGKFGIGLKLVLLSSLKQTGQPVEVYGKTFGIKLTMKDSSIEIADFQNIHASPNSFSTSIIVYSISHDIEALQERVHAYLAELAESLPCWNFLLSGTAVTVPKVDAVFYTDQILTCSAYFCPGASDNKKLEICRSVNFVPLIFNGTDCCLLAGAVASLTQCAASLGLKELRNPGVSDLHAQISCQSESGSWGKLRIRINANLNVDKCQYVSLAKNALVADAELSASVNRAVSKVLARAKRRWPKQLQSLADAGRHAAFKIYIPALAESFANIFTKSTSQEMRMKVEELLGLSNVAGEDFKEKMIERVTAKIKESIPKQKL